MRRPTLKPRSGHACPKPTAAALEAACRNAMRCRYLSAPRQVSHAAVRHRHLRAGAAALPLATAALTLSISPHRFPPSCRSEAPGRMPPLSVPAHRCPPLRVAIRRRTVRPSCRRLSPLHCATVSSQCHRLTPSSSPQVVTKHEAHSHRHLHRNSRAPPLLPSTPRAGKHSHHDRLSVRVEHRRSKRVAGHPPASVKSPLR
jgi:hypothetical protein